MVATNDVKREAQKTREAVDFGAVGQAKVDTSAKTVSGTREVEPEPLPEGPRFSQWVCREDVVWARLLNGVPTSILYKKGDTIEVGFADHETPHRFDYARDFWYPEGAKVVDVLKMTAIPRQFEPFDPDGKNATLRLWSRLLVDPKKINYARNKIPVPGEKKGTPFHFKFEIVRREMDLESIPEPLDVANLVNPPEPPDKFNPSELSRRTGVIH